MNYKLVLSVLAACAFSMLVEAKVKLPAVLSDGMVLQRERPVKIWGTAAPHEDVTVTFKKKKHHAKADESGKWNLMLPAMEAGGPYEMEVNDIRVKDILVGDLWLCSGQSNMELTAGRVTDLFAKEIETDENPLIRYVKTPYGNDLKGPKDDILPMNWIALTKESAPSYSAFAYFFAKEMYQQTQVPVGIINSSWGGSSIEAWMSEDALQAFPKNLRERDLFSSEEYKTLTNKSNDRMSQAWNVSLYQGDEGLHAPTPWYKPELNDDTWNVVDVFSPDWGTQNKYPASGSHWLRQQLQLTIGQTNKDAILRLGCLVDADSVFVNGTFVGTTAYQYPPRIYKVPAALLKTGKNTITIRLINYDGRPSFVKDKLYCMAIAGDTVHLSNQWKYKLGCEMPAKQRGVSFQNIPTGMYNSMISPLRNISFKGIMWYQGETNAGKPNEYEALLTAMINDWREKLCDAKLPFIIIQLPNFMQAHSQPVESNWASMREAQRQVSLKVPNTAMTVAIDLGEWNDIHPLNKKELARRTTLLVRKKVYGQQEMICSGPMCTSMTIEAGKAVLSFEEDTNDLLPAIPLKGFALAGADGRFRWAEAFVKGGQVIVWSNEVSHPISVRYAWDDNPQEANLKNKIGLPASPFQMTLRPDHTVRKADK